VEVIQLLVGQMLNFSYILHDEREAAVVDASFGAKTIHSELMRRNLRLKYILSTHHHFDHVNENELLASLTGALIAAHRSSPVRKDVELDHGDTMIVGGKSVDIIHTPGHTEDSVCYTAGDAIFTGDTLFVGECGRVDLPGGSAEEMYRTLFERLSGLKDETVIYPGHDYGSTPTSTWGREKRTNYVLRPRTLSEFLEFMNTP
jgi:hydroxyacylglutathione hydrolase